MKKILLVLMIIFLNLIPKDISAQGNFGRPYNNYSKYQRKLLKNFSSGKRHKRFIPFMRRSHVYNRSVTKETKRMLRQRYREQIFSKD